MRLPWDRWQAVLHPFSIPSLQSVPCSRRSVLVLFKKILSYNVRNWYPERSPCTLPCSTPSHPLSFYETILKGGAKYKWTSMQRSELASLWTKVLVIIYAKEHVILWKLWKFAVMKGYGVPWMSLLISLLLFVSLVLAFVRCFAIGIDMLRLVVCWNHIDGVAVLWVSPY